MSAEPIALRRALFLALGLLLTAGLAALAVAALAPGGWTVWEALILLCFLGTVPWSALSAANALVGFAIYVDLPEPVSGLRCGMVDHIYVHHDHRQKGIAKAIVDLLADQAEERGWSKLILNAPRQPEDGRKLYEQIAAPSDWTSWIIRFDGR